MQPRAVKMPDVINRREQMKEKQEEILQMLKKGHNKDSNRDETTNGI
ncbi:MAG TPA: hypothetical protein VG847_01090 [Chitinophagaceae bacterium]|nr:hypothetical protein [Chitinophagaceae bacterium]